MSLRRMAIQKLADTLYEHMPKLVAPPTIVAAPPSESAGYPAAAIMMDRFTTVWHNSWDIEVDANGNPLTGTKLTLQRGSKVAMLEGNRFLSRFGTLLGEGRIWVAARHPAKREELEESVLSLFTREGYAPGRLEMSLVNAKIGDFTVPWPWTVVAMVEDTTWKDELALEERIWSYMNFNLDIDILVARNEPIVKQFIVNIMNEPLEMTVDGELVPQVA